MKKNKNDSLTASYFGSDNDDFLREYKQKKSKNNSQDDENYENIDEDSMMSGYFHEDPFDSENEIIDER